MSKLYLKLRMTSMSFTCFSIYFFFHLGYISIPAFQFICSRKAEPGSWSNTTSQHMVVLLPIKTSTIEDGWDHMQHPYCGSHYVSIKVILLFYLCVYFQWKLSLVIKQSILLFVGSYCLKIELKWAFNQIFSNFNSKVKECHIFLW